MDFGNLTATPRQPSGGEGRRAGSVSDLNGLEAAESDMLQMIYV